MTGVRATAAIILAVGLALPALTGCGSGSDESNPSSSPTPTATQNVGGTAELAFAGRQESFALVNCASADDKSLQAAGNNADYALTVAVERSQGEVLLAATVDLNDTIEGSTVDLMVSPDGTFSATGTYQAANSMEQFTLTGACASVDWSSPAAP